MMSEIDLILSQALEDAGETNPDAMLVCGDLCSNGEYSGEFELASKLSKAKKDYDTDIYVVNGNHDINMSYSADFTGEKVTSARRTQAADFKGIYEKLGYGSNARFFNADPQAGSEVKNYGGLSYATEIQDGVTLIALDTAQYSGDENAEYNNGQMTAGYVSDKLLAWAKSEAQAAKKKGNLVLAMCHHSLVLYDSRAGNELHGRVLSPFSEPALRLPVMFEQDPVKICRYFRFNGFLRQLTELVLHGIDNFHISL